MTANNKAAKSEKFYSWVESRLKVLTSSHLKKTPMAIKQKFVANKGKNVKY